MSLHRRSECRWSARRCWEMRRSKKTQARLVGASAARLGMPAKTMKYSKGATHPANNKTTSLSLMFRTSDSTHVKDEKNDLEIGRTVPASSLSHDKWRFRRQEGRQVRNMPKPAALQKKKNRLCARGQPHTSHQQHKKSSHKRKGPAGVSRNISTDHTHSSPHVLLLERVRSHMGGWLSRKF